MELNQVRELNNWINSGIIEHSSNANQTKNVNLYIYKEGHAFTKFMY